MSELRSSSSQVPENFSPNISSRTRAKQRSQALRVQNAAFLLRVRSELPDVNDQDLDMSNHMRAAECFYDGMADSQAIEGFSTQPQQFQELEKVKFRISLHTMDSNQSVTCVDQSYSESDCRLDIFDRIKATMDVPTTYEHLAWRLSVARHKDPPHRLLTSHDIDDAFKVVRTEQGSGRRKKKVVIEIINTMPTLKERPVKRSPESSAADEQSLSSDWTRVQGQTLSLLQRTTTEIISPIIHNHIHVSPTISDTVISEGRQQGEYPIMRPQPLKRTYALYMESDEESSDDKPPQIIKDFLTSVHSRYSAMNLLQYASKLKYRGILYLPTTAGFDVGFYQNKVIGIAWVLECKKCGDKGGCLSDEMGLGKMVQIISVVVANPSNDPICKTNLIVAPLALLDQGKLKIEMKITNNLKCLDYHGSNKPRKKTDLMRYDIVLTTYHTLALEWPDVEAEEKAKQNGFEHPTKKARERLLVSRTGVNRVDPNHVKTHED
ncbi:SNF2 family N-terminal domain-containing protein [Suillus discolor]|uniref:SNF2 family N-terminal domain-containing protein n=1 Tax=Suillus discolor TaxID=1912936 RepID=A0A9P7JL44_9AGAM|nr:SNF2 family N-terminal domain-containing protein [Suillus discolor]KAG2084603.1 SNF2 family N-terminal domain-containing protein [Suillus discolor]